MTGFKFDEPKGGGTNRSAHHDCETCGGDGMVVVATRKPQQTQWMREHGIKPTEHVMEEYAPCPACNAECDTHFRRFDGSYARSLDAEKVRELMRR